MARFCLCFLALMVMIASTVTGQKLFPGRCGMSHPCSQICKDVSGMNRVKCECQSGHILDANGFLCISEDDDIIDIDATASPTEAQTPVGDETEEQSKDQQGSGSQEGSGSGTGDDGDDSGSGEPEGGEGGEILVPSPTALCEEFECKNGGTCYVNVELNKAICLCPLEFEGEMCDEGVEMPSASCEGFKCQNGGTCYVDVEVNKAMCRCPLEFEGDVCDEGVEMPTDPCEGFECQNGGTCYVNVEVNKAMCHCSLEFEGEMCDEGVEMPTDLCEGFECQNGGTCYVDVEVNKAMCRCPLEFEGEMCDEGVEMPTDQCEGFECQNGGTCYVDVEVNKALCHCPLDFEGEVCDEGVEMPTDPCEGFECQNGGTCYVVVEVNKAMCRCPLEFEGEMCDEGVEMPTDPCDGFECQNGGTCYVDVEVNKAMCRCSLEFEGEMCDEGVEMPTDPCEGFECQNGGTCYVDVEVNKAMCRCPLEFEGEMCDEGVEMPTDPCEGFECQNGGTCYVDVEVNKAMCRCLLEFEGEVCDEGVEMPTDPCEGFECQNGGTCYVDVEVNKAMCRCPLEFEGEMCDEGVEMPTDPCEGFQCHNGGTCYVNGEMSKAMCRCLLGYEGEMCSDSVKTPPTSCEGFECQNGGTCYVDGEMNRAMCYCPLGFEGTMCEQSVVIKFPNFQSHSYMEFPTPLGFYRTFQVRLDFKPETLDGLLLFCGEQDSTAADYFSLGLIDGKMQFKYELGGTAPAVITSSMVVSTGKWHTVTVNRDNWNGWIQVDEEKPVKGKSKGLYSKLTLRSPLYLGGHSNYTALSQTDITTGFSGCVERLVINNVDHDMRQEPKGFAVAGVDVGECSSGLCDEGMCSNGGSCVAQSASRYLCLCPLGTAGPTCEKDVLLHIPSFNGSSHLVHQSLGKNHLSFLEIEVVFRPHERTGVLLYSGQKFERTGDFVSLGMSDGHVEFRFDCGSGPAVLRTAEPVKLNEWHVALASRTARDGTLQVDTRRIIEGMAEGAFTQLTFGGDLFIGGVEDKAHISKNAEIATSFVGDIQKVIINDKPLDLIDDAIRGANVMNADHPCVGQPCINRGECVAQQHTYSCQCPLWYEGINCEEEIDEVIQVPSFQGSSYLRFTSYWVLTRVGGTDDNIELEFRTWSSEGLMLWAGRDVMTSTSDFMALGLDNGMLKWSYNLGGGPVSVLTNKTFNDGEWHTVSIQRNGALGTLVVDQREGLMLTAPGPMRSLDINNGFFLGGMKDVAELSSKRYTIGLLGCIRNVVLDNETLDLYQDPSEGRNVNDCQT